jgi:hypothetical protein
MTLPLLSELLIQVADEMFDFRIEYLWQDQAWSLSVTEEMDGYSFECKNKDLNEIFRALQAFLKKPASRSILNK